MWSRRLGGTANDYGYGVVTDAQSNVYVSGATITYWSRASVL